MPAILFDLDGVFYEGEKPLDGGDWAVRFARDRGIPHVFVTNTTSRPRSALVAKLAAMGIEVGEDELLTPPVVACEWLRENVSGPVALFVPPATREEFADLDVLDDNAESGARAVVVGDLGAEWEYATLNRALRLLVNGRDVRLVALGMTRYWSAPDGLRIDTGAFVSALQYASGIEPVVTGKPSVEFFAAAARRAGVEPAQCWMVGDDIRSDVGGAQEAGMRGVLVKTGKYRQGDMTSGVRADAVLESIVQLPGWWRWNQHVKR